MQSRSQIVVTLGPASEKKEVFLEMARRGADVARLNFSWGNHAEKSAQIETIRYAEKALSKKIPIIIDLPGPRIQSKTGHVFDYTASSPITDKDERHIRFGIEHGVDYISVSFVGSGSDILECKDMIKRHGGKQKVIGKVERSQAVDDLDGIIKAADAIMIARGDLGHEFPLEQIPFIEAEIIEKCNKAKKPVITATEMLLSMTRSAKPTRAEVTDVAVSILLGSDAVMLSEETATGAYPGEAVATMERIVKEAEKRNRRKTNLL